MSVTPVSIYDVDFPGLTGIQSTYNTKQTEGNNETKGTGMASFDTILSAAVDMYKEADALQKNAEEAEISFALGYTDSIHDLAVAQQKANISLQYTVKVTNAVVSAYKELMNMQI
ncbi:MAG: flagellar hook-basal body complex protein FliE [Lachnospiraceae bacterium]|nr:flagellar hook-basal body complex protein FliE [Lachnospiraceae bacterium]